MLSLVEITQQLSPEEYEALNEKVMLDGYPEFGIESVTKNSNANHGPVVIVRAGNVKKTYYL